MQHIDAARTFLARAFPVLAAGLTAVGCSTPALHSAAAPLDADGARESSVALSFGQAEMDDEVAWAHLDEPFRVGLQANFGLDDQGLLGLETGLGYASEDTTVMGVDVDSRIIDVSLGLRLSFPLGDPDGFQVVPFVSGGGLLALADVTGEESGVTVEDDDNTFGYYLQAGIGIPIHTSIELGAKYRIVRGTDVTLSGIETDVDNDLLAIYIGFRF